MATLWYQTSGESRALQYQAYRWATVVLEKDLLDKKKSAKRAVVVDIDETALDNAAYQSGVVLSGDPFPKGWGEWVQKGEAPAIAGAVDFLNFASQHGVRIFYVTNRAEKFKTTTMENLKKHGFPSVGDESVICASKEWNKEARRAEIRKNYRIVLLVGDNLNDFNADFDQKNVSDRLAAVEKNRSRWGEEFILIPNPMYGDFEGAVYDFNWKASDEEKSRLRRAQLRP